VGPIATPNSVAKSKLSQNAANRYPTPVADSISGTAYVSLYVRVFFYLDCETSLLILVVISYPCTLLNILYTLYKWHLFCEERDSP
jgi:hypothetical protein